MENIYHGVIFTNHAIKRLYDRKIAQSDAWYTVKYPFHQERGTISGSWKFSRTYGPQTIKVVAKLNDKKEWVIISVWSKVIGNNQPIFIRNKGNWFWEFLKRKFY